jgi:predicted Rossmann-fold nucleotide-binding protein
MEEAQTISPEDEELLFFTDDPKEAVEFLRQKTEGQFGLRRVPRKIFME